MGSWNQTCAMSNLPISDGTPVIGIYLITKSGSDLEGYKYHTPLPFYFEGEYDDYGRIGRPHGVMHEPIMDALRSAIMPQPADEHKDAVDPTTMTFEELMRADVEGGRLLIGSSDIVHAQEGGFKSVATTVPIQHIQIRKDVFDDIIEGAQILYQKDGVDFSDAYNVTFADIMDDWDEFYRSLKAVDTEDSVPLSNMKVRVLFCHRDNYIGGVLADEYSLRNSVITPGKYVLKIHKDGASEETLYAVVENAAKMFILRRFMDMSHRQWVFPGYAGQDGRTRAHCLLARIVIDRSEENHDWEWSAGDFEYDGDTPE